MRPVDVGYKVAENRPGGYPKMPQMTDASGASFVYNDDCGLLAHPCHAGVIDLIRTLCTKGMASMFLRCIPAAELGGEKSHVYATDPHPLAIEHVIRKVQDAGPANARLIKGDATEAGLVSGCIDLALLVGVIPSLVIPPDRLLPEIHRLLRSEGALAVWTAFPWWSPTSLTRSGLFVWTRRESGVHNFRRATSN